MNKFRLLIISGSLLFLTILTLLPFYDQDNLITVLNITFHLYPNRPVFSNAGWPGGPFFMIVWIPTYLAFVMSGLNLSFAYITWKLLLLGFSIGTAIILSSFYDHEDKSRIFLFTILNPSIIYITLFWIQFDIIPVFFATLSFYLLTKWRLNNSFFRIFVAMIPMFIAIFTTYYPLIFIPTLILYSKNLKEKKYILFGSIILGFIFLITDVLFLRGFNFSYVENLNGAGLASNFYQGLQLFITIPTRYYIIFLGIMVLLVPFLLRKKGYGLYTTLYVLLLLFLYTSASAGFDTYLWLFPFTVLAILEGQHQKNRFYYMFVMNIPIFVEAIFSNFIMGTGYQQGIFYFGYEVFHINYLFVKTLAQFQYFVTVFNSVLLASIVGTIIIILTINRVEGGRSPKGIKIENENIQGNDKNYTVNIKTMAYSQKKIIVFLLIFILLSVPISIMFNNTYNDISIQDLKNVPDGLFYPSSHPYGNSFAMSVNNITYSYDRNLLTIYPISHPLYFYWSLNNTLISLNFTLKITNGTNGIYSLINSPIFEMEAFKSNVLNLSQFNVNYPTRGKLTGLNLTNTTIFNSRIYALTLNGSSHISYRLNNNFSNYYHLIAFQYEKISYPEYLWYAPNANSTASASMVLTNDRTVILAFGNESVSIPLENISYDGWNYVLFKVTETGMVIYLNGVQTTINSDFFVENKIFDNNTIFSINYPNSIEPYNFLGNVSLMYNSPSPPNFLEVSGFYVVQNNSVKLFYSSNLNNYMAVNIYDINRTTTVSINGNLLYYRDILTNLTIGKLSEGFWGIKILFHSIYLSYFKSNKYYLVPVFYFTFVPFILIPLLIMIPWKDDKSK
jgi:hypothetical protein